MIDIHPATRIALPSLLLATLFSLALTDCEDRGKHPESSAASATPPAQAAAPDPVAQAHEIGRQWAISSNARLVTDCGALEDADQRFGCAKYVNDLPR